jgi:hypothetical protein
MSFRPGAGPTLARDLIVKTRSGRGGYKPFLHGIARSRPRGRAVRLPESRSLPGTLSLEQVAAVIDCQGRLRDRFKFALSRCSSATSTVLSRILEGLDAIEADHVSSEALDLRQFAAPDQPSRPPWCWSRPPAGPPSGWAS